ncbi:hypothetical protein Pelo_2385 [Pelomyxa schiedti]|nr:hypothetical protein Pelo_2385 [Pelomyxa schiedti]
MTAKVIMLRLGVDKLELSVSQWIDKCSDAISRACLYLHGLGLNPLPSTVKIHVLGAKKLLRLRHRNVQTYWTVSCPPTLSLWETLSAEPPRNSHNDNEPTIWVEHDIATVILHNYITAQVCVTVNLSSVLESHSLEAVMALPLAVLALPRACMYVAVMALPLAVLALPSLEASIGPVSWHKLSSMDTRLSFALQAEVSEELLSDLKKVECVCLSRIHKATTFEQNSELHSTLFKCNMLLYQHYMILRLCLALDIARRDCVLARPLNHVDH